MYGVHGAIRLGPRTVQTDDSRVVSERGFELSVESAQMYHLILEAGARSVTSVAEMHSERFHPACLVFLNGLVLGVSAVRNRSQITATIIEHSSVDVIHDQARIPNVQQMAT